MGIVGRTVGSAKVIGVLKRASGVDVVLERGEEMTTMNFPGFGKTSVTTPVERIRHGEHVTDWFYLHVSNTDMMLLTARVDMGIAISLTEYNRLLRKTYSKRSRNKVAAVRK